MRQQSAHSVHPAWCAIVRQMSRLAVRSRPLTLFFPRPPPHKQATVDHFIPLNGGGWDRYSNMIVSCVPCNQRKGSSLPDSSPHAWTYDGDTDKPDESTAEADVCSGILVILMVIVIFSFIAS